MIQDDEQPPARVAAPQPAERREEIGDALAAAEDGPQTVAVDVVEAEEVPHTLEPAVGRRMRHGSPGAAQAVLPTGLELQGAPFVEADHRPAHIGRRAGGWLFFRSNAGSCEVFHVRMRWARKPAPRNNRRPHSSQNGGIKSCSRIAHQQSNA